MASFMSSSPGLYTLVRRWSSSGSSGSSSLQPSTDTCANQDSGGD
jgi:hypothetical protein